MTTLELHADGKLQNLDYFGNLNVSYKCSFDAQGRLCIVLQGRGGSVGKNGEKIDFWKIEERWGLADEEEGELTEIEKTAGRKDLMGSVGSFGTPTIVRSGTNASGSEATGSGVSPPQQHHRQAQSVDDEDEIRLRRTIFVSVKKVKENEEEKVEPVEGEENKPQISEFKTKFVAEFKKGIDKRGKRLQKRSMSVGGKKESKS